MKIKVKSSHVNIFIISTCIGLFLLFSTYLLKVDKDTPSDEATFYVENELPPIDPLVSDSLPHNRYVKLKDSIKNARRMKNGDVGNSFTSILIGIKTVVRCDSCDFFAFGDWPEYQEHLISLNGWKLDTTKAQGIYPVVYYVKNGKSYLRKTTCRKTETKGSNTIYTCNEKEFAVPFRIDTERKDLLIPISESTSKIIKPLFFGAGILFLLYIIYFLIGGFIKILIEIAQGTPFSDKNVRRLRFITLNLFFIPVGLFLINLIVVPLIFNSYFTSDIRLNDESWKSLGKPAILYLICLCLYMAFKKGKQLKEENDLTV